MWIRGKYFSLFSPEEETSTGGGGDDRGDDFVPTDEDVEEIEAEVEAEEQETVEEEKEEEKEEEEKEENKVKTKREPKIPLSRHKQLLEKHREQREALERRLAQYEQNDHRASTNEAVEKLEATVVELEKEYARFLTDGEPEKAAETMSKIRRTEREISGRQTQLEVQAAEVRAIEQARYDIVVERIESAYPEMDPDNEGFDEELVGEVLEMKRGYEYQRYTPAAALQKAVKYVLGSRTGRQEAAVSTTPRVPNSNERKAAAVKKAIDAATKQPARMKAGVDSDKIGGGITAKEVMKMSQEEFNKLSEEQLSKMRGDAL